MKIHKICTFILILIPVFTIFIGCQKEKKEAKITKITCSSIAPPDATHSKGLKKFKEVVELESKGQIKVTLYFAGQIFTQEGELAACREGTLDMAFFSAGWLAEWVPYLSMIGAVYTFSGYDHMTKVLNGEIGKEIFDEVVEKVGVRPLSAFYLGTRQLNVVKKVGPIRHPDQMKGVKLRTPSSPTWIALGKALGANPTPMSFGEVYIGLKTGVIEGQDNPLSADRDAKFYEVTKYIILTDHMADSVWPTINEKKWQSLSKKEQKIIIDALEVAREYQDKLVLEEEKSIREFFEKEGIIFVDDPDKDAFQKYAANSYKTESKEISKNWDWDLYDRIQLLK